MTQVDDLGPVVCGKVASEALADASGDPAAKDPPTSTTVPPPDDPDFPPESFFVPVDDEADWVDINAVYYDRDDSTKGNTNPKSHHSHAGASKPRSNSLRFSGNLQTKVPIIGLPNAVQHSGYLGRSKRCATSARIFPKKPPSAADRSRKSAVPDHEPSSPKVSCIGKVLSERERERERRRRHRDGGPPDDMKSAGKAGCWTGIAGAFRCCGGGGVGRGERSRVQGVEDSPASSSTSPPSETETVAKAAKRPASRERAESATATGPPALGAMKRFASGRKSAAWEEELDIVGAGALRGAVDGVGSAGGWVA